MKAGWLQEQIQKASEDIQKWEPWMRREAGLDRKINASQPSNSKIQALKASKQ